MHTEVIRLYEGRDDVTLTAYVVSDSPEMTNGVKRPAVLICPGGAYINCSDREGEPVALRFASMGYHAFVLRYSTYTKGAFGFPDLSKEILPNELCQHPKPMLDIGKAFLTIRQHAKEWLVDVDRIAVCGFSAGAHNCAMYSTFWHTPIFAEVYGEKPEVFRPAAAILGYTLSDYLFMKETKGAMNAMDKMLFELSNTALLGTSNPSEEQLNAVSPALHVSKHNPPTFLWATAADSLVPVQHSIRMAHALADQKVPFEIHVFEEGAHGLSIATQASAGSKAQINADAAKWVGLADTWLLKRMELPLPEKTEFEESLEMA
ncbi:alpha/beta hydrolase [Konateibacter massiliensis]|uniref:alpha/beta hydrolase n=1 Tax=Konateibacter massiliensis TaxID=2002841 RepID=UPI000C1559FA|nr:alpha/beta hydrolase [Konateibacter massiliensis]